MIVQLFYCLPNGQFFGSWAGDPEKDHNPLAALGYLEVPTAPESTQFFWDIEKQVFYKSASPENEREWRDAELEKMVWLRDRHRDQLEIGKETTLSVEQYGVLLVYMQALRDWPQAEAFPDPSGRPRIPQVLEVCGGER